MLTGSRCRPEGRTRIAGRQALRGLNSLCFHARVAVRPSSANRQLQFQQFTRAPFGRLAGRSLAGGLGADRAALGDVAVVEDVGTESAAVDEWA